LQAAVDADIAVLDGYTVAAVASSATPDQHSTPTVLPVWWLFNAASAMTSAWIPSL
jgi:hypothetical protein